MAINLFFVFVIANAGKKVCAKAKIITKIGQHTKSYSQNIATNSFLICCCRATETIICSIQIEIGV